LKFDGIEDGLEEQWQLLWAQVIEEGGRDGQRDNGAQNDPVGGRYSSKTGVLSRSVVHVSKTLSVRLKEVDSNW